MACRLILYLCKILYPKCTIKIKIKATHYQRTQGYEKVNSTHDKTTFLFPTKEKRHTEESTKLVKLTPVTEYEIHIYTLLHEKNIGDVELKGKTGKFTHISNMFIC